MGICGVLVGFEFCEEKSFENKAKHGIDFEQAKQLWLDPNAILGPADSKTEDRFIFVGKIAEKSGPRSLHFAALIFGLFQ